MSRAGQIVNYARSLKDIRKQPQTPSVAASSTSVLLAESKEVLTAQSFVEKTA
jgi:hypothetical protein